MPHVGVPKSQVILTAARVERLPYLFADTGLLPGQIYDLAQFRQAILDNPAVSERDLTQSLFQAIQKNDPIGTSAVTQLIEYFHEWDGEVPARGNTGDAGAAGVSDQPNANKSVTGELVLGLLPMGNGQEWQLVAYLSLATLPSSTIHFKFDGSEWAAQATETVGGPVMGTAGGQLMNGNFLLDDAAQLIPAKWLDEAEGERQVQLRCRSIRVRVFHWHGYALVERNGLPAQGDAYVLVHEANGANWDAWCNQVQKIAGAELRNDLPQGGIPAGWQLFYVSGLGHVDMELWQQFPDGGAFNRPRPKTLRLAGGSRARKTGFRRTYLSYDPPRVVLEAEGNVEVTAQHATLEKQKVVNRALPEWARGMCHTLTRQYRITPDNDANVVKVSAWRDGMELEHVSFGISRNVEEIAPQAHTDYRLDETGAPSRGGEGVIGLCVPNVATPWQFYDGHDEVADYGIDDKYNFQGPTYAFISWLARYRRVSFTRAREVIIRLLGPEGAFTTPARETRGLLHLGHLEVQVDGRGRWAYLHATPFCLYTLPLTREGLYQAVVSGTFNMRDLNKLLAAASTENIVVELRPQLGGGKAGFKLAPPRITLLSSDLDRFVRVAAKCEARWLALPPAWGLASWTADCQTWLSQQQWFTEAGPRVEATFRPNEFRTRDGNKWGGDWVTRKFVRLDDPVTHRHFSYYLVRRDEDQLFHAPVTQKAWGCWHVHHDAMTGLAARYNVPLDAIPAAYDPGQMMLVLPLELELPLLLTRSLVACSGLAPRILSADEYSAYRDVDNGFTPGASYTGPCLGYLDAPRNIVDTLLAKVGAVSRDFPA